MRDIPNGLSAHQGVPLLHYTMGLDKYPSAMYPAILAYHSCMPLMAENQFYMWSQM